MSAAPPAPASTITERPAALSRSTTFGTSATRHSPVAVSRGTPISVIFLFLAVAEQNSAGDRTVWPGGCISAGRLQDMSIAYCMQPLDSEAGYAYSMHSKGDTMRIAVV